MIALDTNVVVRVVTRDDPQQTDLALALLASADRLWLSKSVLLETEWVLRHAYGLDRERLQVVFRKLLGYRKIEMEDRGLVLHALDWFGQGLDFADALHLASSPEAESFATFDRPLAKGAALLKQAPSVLLLQ